MIGLAKCGCGGEADIYYRPPYHIDCRVMCNNCGIRTSWVDDEIEAVEAWNTAMGKEVPNE